MRGGKKVVIEKHRLDGVYIARGKEDALCTRNLVPGDSVYGEKRISVDVRSLYHSPSSISVRHLSAVIEVPTSRKMRPPFGQQ